MNDSVSVLNIGILVFREGLECVLVLAAITANMTGERQEYRRLIALGAFAGFIATLVTWDIAARILRDLRQNISALSLQAGTGLLAVVVLLIVMNWFFHRTYWTGWISLHNKRKRQLLGTTEHSSRTSLFFGFALLGFTSFYREGFEVVLFLQSYRLEMAARPMLEGILIGLVCTLIVGVLTFFAHRKLPYKRMLVFTGVLLALVLFVMVGEQIQEMQLAHWLPTSTILWLVPHLPQWTGLWFSIFPTVESLTGQAIAISLVIGSYAIAREQRTAKC